MRTTGKASGQMQLRFKVEFTPSKAQVEIQIETLESG